MHLFRVILFLLACSSLGNAAINVSSSSTLWTVVGGNYDFAADQQTGQGQADIVGNNAANNPGFLTQFDNNGGDTSLTDGFIAFRVRMNSRDGTAQNPDFSNYLWIGIAADAGDSVDGFLNYNGGNSPHVAIYAPGTGLNTSPNTTSISNTAYVSYDTSTPTYSSYANYRAVLASGYAGEAGGIDAGADALNDWYVSFQLPFQDVVNYMATRGITINQNSPLRYVLGTSTQGNALNQDLGGVNGGTTSTTSWSQLGGFSPTMSGAGQVIPEPSSSLLAMLGAMAWLMRRRRN